MTRMKRKIVVIELETRQTNHRLRDIVAQTIKAEGPLVFQVHVNDIGGYDSYVVPDQELAKGATVERNEELLPDRLRRQDAEQAAKA